MNKFGLKEDYFSWDVESGLEEAASESGRLTETVLSEKSSGQI